jgi:two-component system, cell cycle sensor histidine kinase and response regulator CckA
MAQSPSSPAHTLASDRRKCVLVAEDEDLVRELAIEVLRAHGFDTIGARHGGEALTLFAQHADHIDAVLLDLSMPVVDGATVLGELRKQKPGVRIVLTSGYDESAARDDDSASRVSFLQKPYRAERLIAELRAVLNN